MKILKQIVQALASDEPKRTFRRMKVSGRWVDEEVPHPKYANKFSANVSREEVQFLLLQENFVSEDADISAFFVLSPTRLIEFRDFLTKVIENYEQHHGSLKPSRQNDNNGNPPPVIH